ncbi:hypothetical protein [Undibacterium sp.]|uniref:hypothetical protein n=1 Tax=Undibacterium sp. TaxID=1914977 RepID=UPI0025DFAB2A|nr:hypothetical protein [Undibacterium sp.]
MNTKMIFRLAGILAILYLVLLLTQAFPLAVSTVFLLIILYGACRNFVSQTRQAYLFSKWTMVRRIRKMRGTFLASPNAKALYSGCLAFGCVVPLVAQFSSAYISMLFVAISGVFLCVGTIVDWYARLKYLLTSALAKRITFAILGFLGTVTIFLSNVIANHIVSHISKANPAYMPEFVRLASTLIYPFSFTVVISGSLVLVMTVQSIAMLIGVGFTSIFSNLQMFAPPTFNKTVENVVYRLIRGEKPPVSRRWWETRFGGFQHFIRPLGTGAIVVVVIFVAETTFKVAAYVPLPYLQRALVMTEYHTPHLCENADASALISFQDDGYVSVARKEGETYSFSITKCHK